MIKQRQNLLRFSKCFTIFLVLGMYILSVPMMAQVTISLTYTEKNNLTTVQSGDIYTMQLNYSVSSTTGNATGVQAVINLPDNIYDVRNFVGTTHAPNTNFVFSDVVGAKKLTITFVSPVASGSTGVLEFGVLTNNLTTLNNTTLTTTAEMTATGSFTSGVKTNNMLVTAIPRICAQKTLLGGGALDNVTTYRISVYTGGYSSQAPTGTLQATNLTLTDNLPAGAQFVSAKVYSFTNTLVGTGTESGGVVTAAIPDLSFYTYDYLGNWQAQAYYVDIAVQYNAPTFSVGNTVVNSATIGYTPFGGTPTTLTNGQTIGTCTSDLTESTTLVAPVISATLTKSGNGNYYPGNLIYYGLGFENTGNVPLDNVEIIDSIPNNIRIDQNASYRGVRFDAINYLDHTEYQTNLNNSWVSYTPASGQVVPLLPTGEYFSKIKFVLISPFPANTALNGYNQLYFVGVNEPVAPEIVTNCLVWHSTTSGIPSLATRTTCNSDVTLQPRPTTAKMYYYTRQSHPACSPLIGANITYTGTAVADAGFSDATDPVCALLVPHGFQYVSHSFDAGTSGISTAPTLQIIPNYITIGSISKDMYRFTFPSGTILPSSKSFSVTAQVATTVALTAGVSYNTDFIATATNASINFPEYNYGNITDDSDWDLDGNTTETIGRSNSNYNSCDIVMAASASMESIKWVKGLCDTVYTRYPDFGQTVPGGNADYRLVVKNIGNVPMKDVKIIDILPFVGDIGVIDPSARGTVWRPNLADPISAPSGITVYYTTVSNPCRDEVKQPTDPSPFPTGCSTANWSTTPPADITKVQAVKIDFGTTVLAGGDSLLFNWPMRAPVNAPTNNEIAWNSFAFVATRTDNNQPLLAAEPIKVGIKVKAPAPAFYGNRVWFDTNHDGIQDAGEGGVDGIKVKLFSPKISGVQDPVTDSLINFTITGNGGYYIFSNLKPGDYYAVFCLPNGYSVSPKNAGGTADTDSDGATITYNSGTATMAPITNLTSLEIDETWDQGIYCSFSPTVSPIQTVASGSSATLTATGGTTYTWTGPNGFNATTATITINNVTPADTGTYTVNVSDGSCYASLNTKIAICTPPTITSVAADTATCTNGIANSDAALHVTGITGMASYVYGTNGTTGLYATNATASTASSIDITGLSNPASAATYTFRIYASDTTCYNDTTVVLNPSVCPQIVNLTLSKTVDSSCVSVAGRQVIFTLKVKNISATNATGVKVKVTSGSGFTFVSATPSVSYASGTGIWTVGAVNAGDSATLQLSVTTDSLGVNYCTAEIDTADQTDINSTPNNGVTTEDDIARACVSVPMPICPNQSYNATLPNGLTGIQWYKNGAPISGANNQVLTITEVGEYTFTANESTCPVQGCCPIKVVTGTCTLPCKPVICLPVAVVRQ